MGLKPFQIQMWRVIQWSMAATTLQMREAGERQQRQRQAGKRQHQLQRQLDGKPQLQQQLQRQHWPVCMDNGQTGLSMAIVERSKRKGREVVN